MGVMVIIRMPIKKFCKTSKKVLKDLKNRVDKRVKNVVVVECVVVKR